MQHITMVWIATLTSNQLPEGLHQSIWSSQVLLLSEPWRCDRILTFSCPEVYIGTWAPDSFGWGTLYFHVCLFFFVSLRQPTAAANVGFPRRDESTCLLHCPFYRFGFILPKLCPSLASVASLKRPRSETFFFARGCENSSLIYDQLSVFHFRANDR